MKRSFFEESEDYTPNYTHLWEVWFVVCCILFVLAVTPIGELTPLEIWERIKAILN